MAPTTKWLRGRVRDWLACAAAAGLALAALPSAAAATTTTVSGAVAPDLSLAVATPAAMTITHATPGSTSSLVTVTSTATSWTLSIADSSGSTQPGHMSKGGLQTSFLQNPLQWSSNGGSTWNNLSGTPATVTTGSLVGSATVNYLQSLGASEGVNALDSYSLTVTYTAA